MHELFFSFITNPVHQIRLLQYFSANCVSGLSSASGPNLIYADWKICGDFKGGWIRIEADWWPWTAVKSSLCPPPCSAFPLATAQQLLVGILINPIQLRSNLFSNSANMFMEWPQSQCLQVQVAQCLSIQIRICRDLWQQISPCQQPGSEDKPPSLSGLSSVVLSQTELPWIIPCWSRAGSALSQGWTMWVSVVGGTKPSSSKAGLFCWISLSPRGSAPSHFPALENCHPPLQVNYPPNPSLLTSPWHLQLLTEKTLLCSSQKCQPHSLCHWGFCKAFQPCSFPQLIFWAVFGRW